ncbi:MAG: transposase [Lentimicrobium sp.]
MKVEKILPGLTFHIYNRGNNREILFPEMKNYVFFVRLIQEHLPEVAGIYAYCLMPNHFHMALRINDLQDLPVKFQTRPSQALSNLFNSYSKSINKFYRRSGSLFEKNFERKKITDDDYFRTVIQYIHCNPVHHRFCNHFMDYPHSSIHEYVNNETFIIEKSLPLQHFDGLENFLFMHNQFQQSKQLKNPDVE